jgi:uncharacterized protein YcnI/copper(I)-binding protein
MHRRIAFGLSLLSTSAFAASALAHTSFVTASVPAETTIVAALQVPHGCDGKATTELRIKLPEGFIDAKPQPKSGWAIEIIRGDYAKSYQIYGETVSSGPLEIRWKAGVLPDEFYDTFSIQGKVTGIAPGGLLAFPVTQVCGSDAKVTWDEMAPAGVNPHTLKHPAPMIAVTGKDKGGEHAGHEMMMMDMAAAPAPVADAPVANAPVANAAAAPAVMAPVRLGALQLTAGFVKAMLPGQPVGGGFITIANGGPADDRLVSIATAAADRAELHEMGVVNEVMKMRRLDDGIAIPAGTTVSLAPGALHMMFMQVRTPFAVGAGVPVTLTFEKAGKVDVVLPVVAAGPAQK